MNRVQWLVQRARLAPILGLALALATVPGCSSGSNDVAGVDPYSVLPAEEVDKGKAAFKKKLYPDTPPPKAPGVRTGPVPKRKG